MKYQWFHPGNISVHGSYNADNRAIDLPDLEALLLGGIVSSHVHVNLPKLDFRADTKIRGMDLHQAIAAEDNPSLPINPLHWGSRMDVDAITTWVADFKHVDSRGRFGMDASGHARDRADSYRGAFRISLRHGPQAVRTPAGRDLNSLQPHPVSRLSQHGRDFD